MIIEIILAIETVAFIVEGYVIWNLMKKQEMLETWVETYSEKMNVAYTDMRTIDDKGVFEADDEVGEVFTQLKDIKEKLSKTVLEEQ